MREIKTRKRNTRIAIILILATIIFTVLSISNRTFADPASEDASPVNPVGSKHLEYPSIFDLLPASQRDGEYVYIRYEDLIKFPSIMCSARGVTLPGYTSTLVHGRDKTDSGKITGYLKESDEGETMFKDGKVFHNVGNPYSATSSKTYGRFHIVGTYKATPAEGWVLSEIDMNDPQKSAIVFTLTNQEWTDTTNIVDANKHLGINNTTLWAVEWDDATNIPTKFVTKVGEKYYVVTTDEYAPYTYVQYAWWKVKKVGVDAPNLNTLKDTDLAYEAEAFEEYVKRIAVFQNEENYRTIHGQQVPIGKWQWNADNTIKVDYTKYKALDGKNKELGYDASKYEVRFNSETNKYVVGPFTLNYLRAGTKQGTRDKVSFSGISQASMFGLGEDNERLLDAEGKSVLQLKTAENPNGNYQFIYDHDHEAYIPTIKTYNNGTASEIKLDTVEDYPYPYDGEEFYIEIDYLDDLVSLESLDFDFQYMNAGGEFEYLEGTYLIIHWVQRYNKVGEDSSSTGGSGGSVIRNQTNITLGMADLSSRAATTFDGNLQTDGSANDLVGGDYRSTGSITAVEVTRPGASLKEVQKIGSVNISCDDFDFDTEELGIHVWTTTDYGEKEWAVDYREFVNFEYSYNFAGSGTSGSGSLTSKDNTFKIKREFDAPYEELTINFTENYIKHTWNSSGVDLESLEETTENCSHKFTFVIKYYNIILKEELNVSTVGTAKFAGSCIFIEQPGVITQADTGCHIDAQFEHGVTEVKAGKILHVGAGFEVGSFTTTDLGEYTATRPCNATFEIHVYSDLSGEDVQCYKYHYYVPKMFVNTLGNTTGRQSITNGKRAKFTVYNIWESYSFDDSSVGDPIICGEASSHNASKGIFKYAPNLDAVGNKKSVTGSNTFKYTDGAGNSISLTVFGTLYNNKDDNPAGGGGRKWRRPEVAVAGSGGGRRRRWPEVAVEHRHQHQRQHQHQCQQVNFGQLNLHMRKIVTEQLVYTSRKMEKKIKRQNIL